MLHLELIQKSFISAIDQEIEVKLVFCVANIQHNVSFVTIN